MISFLRLLAALSLVSMAAIVHAAEPAIIARARARLAPDAVLDAVKSIHYSGTLVGPDPAEPGKLLRQSIEIFLQQPDRQRIVVTSDKLIEVSALDGYDAWRRRTDAKDPTKWQQSQLSADEIKQLRADVWENLAFYRGIERVGGRVEDQGPATIDGIACEKIAFFHSATLVYFRYFAQTSGELIYTGTEDNNIREQGEISAGGIRFPKAIVVTQLSDGKKQRRTVAFDKITVNETFPDSLFAVPLATSK